MKRTLTATALMVVSFIAGWIGHARFNYDPNTGLYRDDPESSVQWQFVLAAGRGDVDGVKQFFQKGARINADASDEDGYVTGFPALQEASENGQSEVVDWLLAHGANPNEISGEGNQPLDGAEYRVREATKTVAILKAHGARNYKH